MVTEVSGRSFDPETLDMMRAALDAAWASLLPAQQAHFSRTTMAERILAAVAQGERDPVRLRARALLSVAHAE